MTYETIKLCDADAAFIEALRFRLLPGVIGIGDRRACQECGGEWLAGGPERHAADCPGRKQ